MTQTVKRFIAGAVCPRCAEMDKIKMFEQDGTQVRECVACGFSDQQDDGPSDGTELETRVNQPRGDAKLEPVVFFRSPAEDDTKK